VFAQRPNLFFGLLFREKKDQKKDQIVRDFFYMRKDDSKILPFHPKEGEIKCYNFSH
jgi:hypothetical protein